MLLVGVASIWVASCGHQRGDAGRPISPLAVATDERLGVEDVFDVRVFGESEFSGSYRVAADGTVDYPFAGRLSVVGLSSGEVQELITKKLQGDYLRKPQVSIIVREWNSRKVSVLGQVNKPGPIPYFPNMTIVDAVAAAGGFSPIADKNTVILRREVQGKVVTQTYRVAEISQGKQANVVVLPGDMLMIEERIF